MKKINIWIFQTGEPLPRENEYRGMRLTNLYRKAKEMGENVLVISTNFNHSSKTFREKNNNILPFIINNDVVLIKSPGYKNNISLLRLIDHTILSFNLIFFLILSKNYFRKPSISFIGFPPIEWAFIAVLWSKFNNIKTILDIKDLWPEIFYENKKGLKKVLIYFLSLPYAGLKHLTLFMCDKVCLPTKSYASKCLKIHPKLNKNKVVCPLAPSQDHNTINNESKSFYKNISGINLNFDGLSIIFIGSLMATAYDFRKVFAAIIRFKNNNPDKKIRLLICGNGPLYQELKKQIYIYALKEEIFLIGWVNREEMIEVAGYSDIAIAPYKNIINYHCHLPNKIIDYLQLGLPIISSLRIEFQDLIRENKVGFFYDSEEDLVTLLELIYNMKNLDLIHYKSKARQLWENDFNTNNVYEDLIHKLRKI